MDSNNMKRVIIGMYGTGKTTFIANEIIPNINGNYLIFDFCKEYSRFKIGENGTILEFSLSGSKLKENIIDVIRNIKDEDIIIIDSAQCIYFPLRAEKDLGFNWLLKELKNKRFVIVLDSFRSLQGIEQHFDEFDIFPIIGYPRIDFFEELTLNNKKFKFHESGVPRKETMSRLDIIPDMDTTVSIDTLLGYLEKHGGRIISTNDLSPYEISQATVSNRIFEPEEYVGGFIWEPVFKNGFPVSSAEVQLFEWCYPLPHPNFEQIKFDPELKSILEQVYNMVNNKTNARLKR